MTYFHMGKPHTIIGAEWFHCRVRDGIGWYPNAVVAGRTGVLSARSGPCIRGQRWHTTNWGVGSYSNNRFLMLYVAYNRSSSAPLAFKGVQLLGCYMVKPHGQLVPVSFTHCCASTPGLSTLWSSRALQESLRFSENSSWEGLPA